MRLSKSDWLRHGLEALRLYGRKGLNVEALAQFIGVTKGSYYWHFKDQKKFFECLIEYWENEQTALPIQKVNASAKNPVLRLKALIETVLDEELGKYDSDIRALASYEELADQAISRVDKERLNYVKSLFDEMGFSQKEADMRSRVFYLHFIGE